MDLCQTATRAGRHPSQVVRDLVERDGDRPQHAGRFDKTVAGTLGLEVVPRLGDRKSRLFANALDHLSGEPRLRVEPGPDSGSSEREFPGPWLDSSQSLNPMFDRRGIAAELLTEGYGRRVHEVRASRLYDVFELLGLGAQRRAKRTKRRHEVTVDLSDGCQVDCRRNGVVRGLRRVHLVVWTHGPPE